MNGRHNMQGYMQVIRVASGLQARSDCRERSGFTGGRQRPQVADGFVLVGFNCPDYETGRPAQRVASRQYSTHRDVQVSREAGCRQRPVFKSHKPSPVMDAGV